MPTLVFCAILAACATLPPDDSQQAEWLWQCDESYERDQTIWCLAPRARQLFLIRRVAGGVPVVSEALPIPQQKVPGRLETFDYGFDSLWLSYSGSPMGVLRIDPNTLAIQAQIDVVGGAKGEIAVGQTAVWALSNGFLSRVDPSSNTISSQVAIWGLGIAASPGVVWVAGLHSVMKIDAETLDVVQIFAAPEGTHISSRLSWGRWSPRLAVSGQTVSVPLGITRKGFFSSLTCASNCPAELVGTLDHTSGTIVVDPASEH